MNTLELFCGGKSFSKGVQRNFQNAECITLDNIKRLQPTHCCDILAFDYKQYPVKYFDIIWASPPCTEYSKAKTRKPRDLELADRLVRQTFEIIEYLQPRIWIMENVGTGLLVKRMDDIRPNLKMFFVDYCRYGMEYRKRTVLWSNMDLQLNLCLGKGKCIAMQGSKHIRNVGNGNLKYNPINSVHLKNKVPDLLIDDILNQII